MTLLEILKAIKAGQRKAHTGICGNVQRKDASNAERHIRKLKKLWKYWPEYSGSPDYPVPDLKWIFEDGNPAYKFRNVDDYWSPMTRYGRARRRLLDWLIQELEREKNS